VTNSARVVASTVDNASGPLDRIRGKWEALQKTGAKGLAIGAGAAVTTKALNLLGSAIGGVTGFVEESVAAYREQQVASGRLSASLKANASDWIGNARALDDATKASMALGFTDTETANSIATLVAATHSQAQALHVLTVAQDLARFKGISLGEAAQALTAVEAGRARGLAMLGINVKDFATTEERLAAVEKVAGGQARTYADTDLGKLDKATARVDQAQEKFGKGLSHLEAEILPAAADALETVANGVDGLQTAFDRAASSSDRLKGAQDFFSSGLAQVFVPGANTAREALDLIDDSMHRMTIETAAANRETYGAAKTFDRYGEGIAAAAPKIAAAVDTGIIRPLQLGTETARHQAVDNIAKTPAEIGAALVSGYSIVESAMQTLLDAQKEPLSRSKRIAHLEGILTGQELAAGLISNDPLIAADAAALKDAVTSELKALRESAPGYGARTAKAYADGLRSQYGYVHDAALYVTRAAVGAFKASSPPGPESPLHKIDVWGERTGETWADSFAKGLSSDAPGEALGGVAARLTPSAGGSPSGGGVAAAVAVAPAGGDLVININSVWPPTPEQIRAITREIARQDYYGRGRSRFLPD
jgi:hypothetical protein